MDRSASDGDGDDAERGSGEAGEPGPIAEAGVLGNLPRSRPSVRSPRRAAKPAAERPVAEREPPPQPSSKPDADAAPPTSAPPDIESIARGGIAIAGEAAALGLRIAGRAAAAVRDAVERR